MPITWETPLKDWMLKVQKDNKIQTGRDDDRAFKPLAFQPKIPSEGWHKFKKRLAHKLFSIILKAIVV